MKRQWTALVLMMFCLTGCGLALLGAGVGGEMLTRENSFVKLSQENKKKLDDLVLGISRKFVLSVMGNEPSRIYRNHDQYTIANPFRTEQYKQDGKDVEVLFYFTDAREEDSTISASELTPLVILDDKLQGWGWDYYNENIKGKIKKPAL